MSWTVLAPEFAALNKAARARLDALKPMDVPAGATLFMPGEAVKGYVIVLSGRVEVNLLGPGGRDILLYEVAPGQSCIQSTLGLLGGSSYTAEAVAATDARLVLVPRIVFEALLNESGGFRKLVFSAFSGRMQSMMQLIEKMSFLRVEARLAGLIISRADASGSLAMTQANMARAIGSAREVISRRLEKLARAGLVRQERGAVHILDRRALEKLAKSPAI